MTVSEKLFISGLSDEFDKLAPTFAPAPAQNH
jgi:hypothetical protein